MLSEDVMEKLGERLTNRINEANEYILKKIAESVKRIGSLSFSQAQQVVQILKMGGDYRKIVKKLAEVTDLNIIDIERIFTEVAKKNQEFIRPFYEYRKIPFTPYEENKALQEQVEAIKKITEESYLNIARTKGLGYLIKDNKNNVVFRSIDYVYNEVLDRALLSIAQGKSTFNTEMYRIMKDIGKSGLRYIEYESGNIRRLDSAIRQNLLGGMRDLTNNIQMEFGKEFDADGVEISVHEYPAPDHAKVQGRQFSNEQFENFQNDKNAVSHDGMKFPAIASETGHDRRSIGQYNCYHYIFPIILDVSEPLYSKEELQKILERNAKGFDVDGKHYRSKYEGTQMQRQLETRIREQKDMQILAKESGNQDLLYDSQRKINELTKKYNEFSKKAGLPTKKDRLRVSGYRPVKIKSNVSVVSTVSNKLQAKDIAVHYGNLGKGRDTNFFAINSSRRSTGHFGYGTYFISKEEAIKLENSEYFTRGDRPRKEVDFSQYDLYKPLIESEAWRLHDGLKAVNYGEYEGINFELMKSDLIRNGITEEKINKAVKVIEQKRKEFEKENFTEQLKEDSLSTIFMKELGYNGIDVRGLDGLDNTGYGSVVYDLKRIKVKKK